MEIFTRAILGRYLRSPRPDGPARARRHTMRRCDGEQPASSAASRIHPGHSSAEDDNVNHPRVTWTPPSFGKEDVTMPREYDKDVKAKAIRLDRDHALTRPQVSCDPGDLVAAVENSPVRLPRSRETELFARVDPVTGSGRARAAIPVTMVPRSSVVAPWSCRLARQDQQSCISRGGGAGASDKSSDNQRKKSSVKRVWEVFCCGCGWCPDLGFLLRLALVCPRLPRAGGCRDLTEGMAKVRAGMMGVLRRGSGRPSPGSSRST